MTKSAYQVMGHANKGVPLVLTCEHASNRIPEPLQASGTDKDWLQTHWGWDPGIANTTKQMFEDIPSVAVLSTFSRLVCDPNRTEVDPTWIRTEVEGHTLSFNEGLDEAERKRRFERYHNPYHRAIEQTLEERLLQQPPFFLLSMHSFTPVLGDEVREMEIGILFDRYEDMAEDLAEELTGVGFRTALNEPYSGFEELIYSVSRHGNAYRVPYLELEVRQDLIDTPVKAQKIGRHLSTLLQKWLPRMMEGPHFKRGA